MPIERVLSICTVWPTALLYPPLTRHLLALFRIVMHGLIASFFAWLMMDYDRILIVMIITTSVSLNRIKGFLRHKNN